jgi:indolepyruvate ferredoxin oxidoreductase
MERRLLSKYEGDLGLILRALSPGKIEAAAALASVPALIRGYGHVKQASALKAEGERKRLVERLNAPVEEVALQAAE